MSGHQRERTETVMVGDLKSIRSIRANGPNEYFGLQTFSSLILAILPTSQVLAYRGRAASFGVISKGDLYDAAERHFGAAFGRLDKQVIAGANGGVIRWKRTMAWAKVTLQRRGREQNRLLLYISAIQSVGWERLDQQGESACEVVGNLQVQPRRGECAWWEEGRGLVKSRLVDR
jgi:hypothetical protein